MKFIKISLLTFFLAMVLISPYSANGEDVSRLPSLAKLAKELKPTVVNISSTKLVQSPLEDFFKNFRDFRDFFGEEFFQRFFGERHPKEFRQQSLGSGFIIDREGYIITNWHVIEKAEEIKVKLSDKKIYDAEVVGKDPKTDLALIKIKIDEDLPVARLGDSDKLEVGDWVVAIGNPFGLEHTVTTGIISAKGRVIGAGPYDDFLQTDASINPGNSGGPLFNLKGEVVGINTAIIAGGQGIGFAIPINMAKRLLPQLKRGRVVYGYLGVYIQDLTLELARSFGLKEPKGVLISEVIPDSPAVKGGVEKGDICLEFDGLAVENTYQFRKLVSNIPGKKVKILVLRKGKQKTLSVTIGELKEREVAALRYKLARGKLLKQRDEFIAGRINETLAEGETGILFIGAYHDVVHRLAPDIRVGQVKEVTRVKEYHKSLINTKRHDQQLAGTNCYQHHLRSKHHRL